jgi:hypothetical protein
MMNANWKNRTTLVLAATLVVVALLVTARWQPALAEHAAEPSGVPHYAVVETEGHNLIVTDNLTNTLYFYTIDKDKEVGSELKLRGSIDLSQVGKPVIKPTETKK